VGDDLRKGAIGLKSFTVDRVPEQPGEISILAQNTGIRLILETDAITHPLTGIGRYALELLQAFHGSAEFIDIRCLSRGRWYDAARVIAEGNALSSNNGKAIGPINSRNRARAALGRLVPYINQRKLEKLSDSYIYHSPNYRLSPFKGRKIATFHDLSLFLYPQYHPENRLKLLRPAIERAVHEADHLITDTMQVRQEVMSYFGVPAERISAIPLATSLRAASVDETARDHCLAGMGLHPGKYFLFVSTLEPRKNISGLLGAYELLPAETRRQFPLVLAGQLGWKSNDIEKTVDRAVRRGDVLQTGYLSNRDLCHLYSGARAFVYPTFYEGFGLPVIEAQEFGIPVITSDCSCLPEVAGQGAILVNPESFGTLASAMQRLAEDDELHAQLKHRGKENVERFSWKETARQTALLYRKIIDAD
jgi:alpha-1,3-rhamnosyl/mannosyltransferase